MSLNLIKGSLRATPSLMALNEWQEKEKQSLHCAVDEDGALLDNLTLELRVHPPEVHIDNTGDPHSTLVTIDSANRPGSLVFVVQHITELGLRINSARISSDGGWFHDMFLVSEAQGGKVRNPKKLQSVKQMLNVYMHDEDLVANGDDTDDAHRVESTVFELSGVDRAGLLADVMQLLTHSGCNVRSAAVWTYKGRVAFVFSVTEKGKPVTDEAKLQRLRVMVGEIMQSMGGSYTVRSQTLRGEVHHDRRLHQLMLEEERSEWERARAGAGLWSPTGGRGDTDGGNSSSDYSPSPVSDAATKDSSPADSMVSSVVNSAGMEVEPLAFVSPKLDRPVIEISHCHHPNYWTVSIRCRDRTKLLFDTVCTLADLDFDIYHATIDSGPDGWAHQEFFLRPRSGDGEFSAEGAALLQAMLDSSIQRRFPKGIKVHVKSMDRYGCLAALARQLQQAGLSITRAKVRTFATSNSCGHTLYVTDAQGALPDKARVQRALMDSGGRLMESGEMSSSAPPIRAYPGDTPAAVAAARQGRPPDLPRRSDPSSAIFSFGIVERQRVGPWGSSPTDSFGSL